MQRFWQKDALLVRNALPGFTGMLDRDDVFELAMRDDVESRLVRRDGGRWTLVHGPVTRSVLHALPARDWTLLVQGVNLHVPQADALLRQFAFVPYARLDDVMVSYAAPGGGVGAHLDAYDVFLLQGFGRRRWRYGRQQDAAFRAGLPLRILRRFVPAHDEVLGPGDMLYLPPQFGHDGTALERCTTYSIGFRAPTANELARAFLDYLHEHLDLPGQYADPDLVPAREPARIGSDMQHKITAMLSDVHWTRRDVARFIGVWLTEPKATVFFDVPARRLSRAAFLRAAKRAGLRLDARSQMLFDDERVFVNGESVDRRPHQSTIIELANARTLLASHVSAASAHELALLYDWYCHGYVHLESKRA